MPRYRRDHRAMRPIYECPSASGNWNGHGYVTTLPMAIPDMDISADRQTDRRHYCDNSWSLVHYCVTLRSTKNRHLQTARTSHTCKPTSSLWPDWVQDFQAGSGRVLNFWKLFQNCTRPPKMAFPIHDVHRPYNSVCTACLTVMTSLTHAFTLRHRDATCNLVYRLLNEQFTITKKHSMILID